MINQLKSKLFQPISIASLVFFRIVFGVLGFADVLSMLVYYHFIVDAYNPDRIRFPYIGFEWLPTFHDPWISMIFIVILIAAVGVIIGWRYQLSATIFAIGFTYIFLLEKCHYLNHGYLFCWLSFIMIVLPADRAFSLSVWRKPELYTPTIPLWGLLPLPLLMGLVYFYGGIAKLNPEWMAAVPLQLWLKSKGNTFLIGGIVTQDWVPYFMAWGGLVLDLTISFFLLNRYTRPFAFAGAVFFHFINHLIFNIGIFPFLSVALTALFFSPDFPLKIVSWWKDRVAIVRKWYEAWAVRLASAKSSIPLWQAQTTIRNSVFGAFIAVILIHSTIPFRHHFYPGDVAWTEEGHKYSWRMMLRSKSGRGHFTVVKSDGTKEDIDLKDHLYRRQRRKVLTRPDLMIQFAHIIRDQYREKGEEVEVYAKVRVKLNGRARRRIVDPEYDLAKAEWHHFRSSEWILPYEE
jgi:hypothetical protein